jgi:very-short-patch-repair endonuclease
MSWRERLNVHISNAEMQIFQELQRRHLCTYLTTQQPWAFNLQEDMVAGTFIDFYWHIPHQLAAFIDGLHHLKQRQEQKDAAIDRALRKRGVTVERFPYHPPLRTLRRIAICDRIEHQLNQNGESP